MINPQKPVINPIKIFNRFTALIKIHFQVVSLYVQHTNRQTFFIPYYLGRINRFSQLLISSLQSGCDFADTCIK